VDLARVAGLRRAPLTCREPRPAPPPPPCPRGAGSIPEREEASPFDGPALDSGGRLPRIFNTCVAFGPDGELLARHRKMHLFDIDIPGRIAFRESDTLSAGDRLALFDTPYGRVGLGVCYDMRFPHLAALLRAAGAKLLFYPGAFNTTTGPPHYELLQRARALDNQCFVCTVSPARNPDSKYQAWGHSSAISPYGEVLATTDERPGIVYAELRLAHVEEVRAQIPVGVQARTDLYSLEWRGPPRELMGRQAAEGGGKQD
jgi:omega-amidase